MSVSLDDPAKIARILLQDRGSYPAAIRYAEAIKHPDYIAAIEILKAQYAQTTAGGLSDQSLRTIATVLAMASLDFMQSARDLGLKELSGIACGKHRKACEELGIMDEYQQVINTIGLPKCTSA